MTAGEPLSESTRGYLSQESKRRFPPVAGILGAAFFLAQFLLPMLVMLLVMMPMLTGRAVSTVELDQTPRWQPTDTGVQTLRLPGTTGRHFAWDP